MRITEQIESLEGLSIACHHKAAGLAPGYPPSSSESSPLMTPETSDDEEDHLQPLPEPVYRNFSGSDKDVVHTKAFVPEPTDDIDANLIPSSEVAYSPFDDEHKLPFTPVATASESSEVEDEDSLHLPQVGFEHWGAEEADVLGTSPDIPELAEYGREGLDYASEVEHTSYDESCQDLLDSSTSTQTDDECEHYFDALAVPSTFYGSRLSCIRHKDKATVEETSLRVSGELTPAQRRVLRELKTIHEDETTPFLSAAPIEGNLLNCLACMEGAWGTPWEGGVFWLHFKFPGDYPLNAPVITFLTTVYHPNIEDGRICLDILEDAWSPCLQTQTLLLSILSVLHHPILDDALVPEIAEQYQTDYDQFCDIARIYTEEGAHAVRPDPSNLFSHLPSPTSGDLS